MILKKVYFPKSKIISKEVSIYIRFFKLGQEKMVNNTTMNVIEKVLAVSVSR